MSVRILLAALSFVRRVSALDSDQIFYRHDRWRCCHQLQVHAASTGLPNFDCFLLWLDEAQYSGIGCSQERVRPRRPHRLRRVHAAVSLERVTNWEE